VPMPDRLGEVIPGEISPFLEKLAAVSMCMVVCRA
jgi:hypothetical protein